MWNENFFRRFNFYRSLNKIKSNNLSSGHEIGRTLLGSYLMRPKQRTKFFKKKKKKRKNLKKKKKSF